MVDEPDRFGFGYGTLPIRRVARRRSWWSRDLHDAAGTVRLVIAALCDRHPLVRLAGPWRGDSEQAAGLRRGAGRMCASARLMVVRLPTDGRSARAPARSAVSPTGAGATPSLGPMGEQAVHHVSAEQVVAFRVAAHNLNERLPKEGIVEAAGVCGVQDTPPGNAGVALAARVAGFTPMALEDALRRPVAAALPRPSRRRIRRARVDATVFGPGALAADEASLREQLGIVAADRRRRLDRPGGAVHGARRAGGRGRR